MSSDQDITMLRPASYFPPTSIIQSSEQESTHLVKTFKQLIIKLLQYNKTKSIMYKYTVRSAQIKLFHL